MKTKGLSYSAAIIVLCVLSVGLAWAVDISNTFVGGGVGTGSDINTTTTGTHDVFIGDGAGLNNGSGNANTFVGHHAGLINAGGGSNTFIG